MKTGRAVPSAVLGGAFRHGSVGEKGEQCLIRVAQVPAEVSPEPIEKVVRLVSVPLFSNSPNWINQETVEPEKGERQQSAKTISRA